MTINLIKYRESKLLDQINNQAAVDGFISMGAEPYPSVTVAKDSKLLSNFQTKSSKMVGENGEPMVVYHQTDSTKCRKNRVHSVFPKDYGEWMN